MLPNFIVLGTAKAGTSSLYAYLKQHPDIYLPEQTELNFFAHEGRTEPFHGPGDELSIKEAIVTTFGDYVEQFAGAGDRPAIGEVSTHYLYSCEAAARMKRRVPDARLIAILRQPVDRAYSAFTNMVRDGREETPDFRSALRREPARIAAGWEPLWHYLSMGYYSEQVSRYYNVFSRQRVRVYLYDDWAANPQHTFGDILAFLGVDPTIEPDMSERYNVSVVPRRWRIHKLITADSRLKEFAKKATPADARQRLKAAIQRRNLVAPQLEPSLRRELTSLYAADIDRLEALLDRDLGLWRQ